MIGLLQRAAEASPDRTAVITPAGAVSYGRLLEDAQRVAGALRERGITRLAIVEPDVAWVLRLLAGAALAGAEPCQYQADIAPAEFAGQARAVGHAHIVTRRTDLDDEAFDRIAPEELLSSPPAPLAGERLPQRLIIRTTGTTGAPKAVLHDWERLGRTVAQVQPRPGRRWLMAYGPHQFAGIQVMLHVLAGQATLVAPFPRQPADGLAAILRDDVTCVSATPTYWRFLLAQARSLDVPLPALEQVTLGGEASSEDLLAQLRTAFPDARISQVYASTEFGSVASVADGRAGFDVAALFSAENPTSNLRVVDGELWVRAAAGMLGYAGEADAEATGDPAGEWRPTGDLAEITGDRVVFHGRTSEIINVGGVKVHPLPVESRITGIERVALARVFGRPNRMTGAIVAAEVVAAPGVPEEAHEDLRAEIRDAMADLPRAWHPRSITFVQQIATQGAKTLRRMQA